MRKLATIRQIDKLTTILNADRIETAEIGGWEVVVKKGQYQEQEIVVYVEIDSWVPINLLPDLQQAPLKRYFNNIEGTRIRTIKLRGKISQGLVLDLKQDQATYVCNNPL